MVAVSLIEFPSNAQFIPKSVYLYFKDYSFGQKKYASPWMTFFLSRIYKDAVNYDPEIINTIKEIDARSLKGAIGGPKKRKN